MRSFKFSTYRQRNSLFANINEIISILSRDGKMGIQGWEVGAPGAT